MATYWETVRDRLRAEGHVFVALVVDHSVHSPGTTGARMAVFADGTTFGTIGGGIMESKIVQAGLDALSGDRESPRLQKLVHRKEGEGEKSGLICAGFQTNLYTTLHGKEHGTLIEALVEAERDDRPAFLEIGPDGLNLRVDGDLDNVRQYDLVYSGKEWLYRECVMNLNRVAIMGGGHCGLAVSKQMRRLGYYVSIFDTRPRVPTMLENDFTDEKHIVGDFSEAGAMIRLPGETKVVVMTTALPSDIRALLGLVGKPFPFVGVMGSQAKIVAIRKALLSEGIDRDWIDALVAPVGLPIGSNTPDEIAVSVAAQLLQLRPEVGKTVREA